MDIQNVWTIASKELGAYKKKKSLLYSTILFPVLVGIGFPLLLGVLGQTISGGIPDFALPGVINSFMFFFIIGVIFISGGIASYSIIGEKVEKSLEPLLATPITDSEILLGKSIAAFLPALLATYGGAAIFATLIDVTTASTLGYLYFPNISMVVTLFAVVPLVCLVSVEVAVLISAKINDVRAANQYGGVLAFPFVIIYVAGETSIINLNTTNLLLISATILVVDVLLFFLSKATFQREEILTKWR
jgi:ABC-2 type transport system permease protein